jgi:hypothetical protein
MLYTYSKLMSTVCGPGSVVGIATGYGLDGPGIESRLGARFSAPVRPWGPPSLLYNGYRGFPEVKGGRGVTLTPHPLQVPWSRKGRAIPLLPLWAVRSLSACTRVTFTFLLLCLLCRPIWKPSPSARKGTRRFAVNLLFIYSLIIYLNNNPVNFTDTCCLTFKNRASYL